MTRPAPTGLAHSVQARLKNVAMQTGRPFAEVMELYAIERFIHRLGRSPHRERFVLKGALLLRQWLGADTRPTRDIDLLGPPDLDASGLHTTLEEIVVVEAEDDAIAFNVRSIAVQPIRAGSAVLGLRAKFDARLGQVQLRYQVDVGLGDAIYPPEVEVIAGGLLGMPMASVRAYTPYTTVVEKLEAIIVHGDANTRTKDYYDLVQLPNALAFDGRTLAEAMRRTVARRGTAMPTMPLDGLCDDFANDPRRAAQWTAFLAKGSLHVAEANFGDVVAAIRRFAEPMLGAVRGGMRFDRRWQPGGPWR